MQFLPDVYVTCELCNGQRYERETLEVRYRGFRPSPRCCAASGRSGERAARVTCRSIGEALAALRAVGLGYLQLGQSATTLSAGEAQRMRLARELRRGDGTRCLYVLDEPTSGLHPSEVELLDPRCSSVLVANEPHGRSWSSTTSS